MYKKVFEKKFQDAAKATEVLDATGWEYQGRKGFVRKYHLYTGVTMNIRGQVCEAHQLHMYSDGHVELFNDYSLSATISTTGLPTRVWASKDFFDHLNKTITDLNEKLANEYGHEFFIQWNGHKQFGVYRLESQVLHPGKTIKKPAAKSFDAPVPAFDWAISESKRLRAIRA